MEASDDVRSADLFIQSGVVHNSHEVIAHAQNLKLHQKRLCSIIIIIVVVVIIIIVISIYFIIMIMIAVVILFLFIL